MTIRIRGLIVAAVLGLVLAGAGCGSGGDVQILDIDPQAGPISGSQMVKILGHNFRTDIGYSVWFGRKRALSVTVVNPDTMVVTTPQYEDPGAVDIRIVADDGPAFRIPKGFKYQKATGNVMEQIGGTKATKKGNLAY